jgi:hypothetical protein
VSNPNEYLMGGGTKSLRIAPKGTPVTIRITQDPEVRQQTDFKTKEPKFFKNGDPMNQLVVTGQSTQLDPDDAADDGIRAAYIKGKQMTSAVREAVKAAGARGLDIGGDLTLTWVSGGPRFEGDQNWATENPKIHTASYVKPAGASAAFLGSAEPAQQQAAQPVAAADDPKRPPSVDVATWAQLDSTARAGVRAALGLS